MTSAVQDLYKKATGLSPDERAALAALLLDSLDGAPDQGAEDAWAGEIDRRMADYRAGRVKTISWQELRARLHRRDR